MLTRYARMEEAERNLTTRRWSLKLLNILGLHVKVNGLNSSESPTHTLIVANHISWLDIFVLNSFTVSRFVAKREISEWPIVGNLVKAGGTLFIDRSNRRDASRMNTLLAEAMSEGGCMAVFPEATTSEGTELLPFKASLFEAALLSGGKVLPVSIRYQLPNGEVTIAPSYAGDTTFMESLKRILATPRIDVELSYCQPLTPGQGGLDTRFDIADRARLAIATQLRLPLHEKQGTAEKTAGDLQGVTQ